MFGDCSTINDPPQVWDSTYPNSAQVYSYRVNLLFLKNNHVRYLVPTVLSVYPVRVHINFRLLMLHICWLEWWSTAATQNPILGPSQAQNYTATI